MSIKNTQKIEHLHLSSKFYYIITSIFVSLIFYFSISLSQVHAQTHDTYYDQSYSIRYQKSIDQDDSHHYQAVKSPTLPVTGEKRRPNKVIIFSAMVFIFLGVAIIVKHFDKIKQ